LRKYLNKFFYKRKKYKNKLERKKARTSRFKLRSKLTKFSKKRNRLVSKLSFYRNWIINFKRKYNYIYLIKGKRREKKTKKGRQNFYRRVRLNRWIIPSAHRARTRKPGGGFVPTYLDNVRIIDEFSTNRTPFIALVDSNVNSSDVLIPFLSNDDSLKCVNFFLYLIVKNVFIFKFKYLQKWKYNIVSLNKRKFIKKKCFFLKTLDTMIEKENLLI